MDFFMKNIDYSFSMPDVVNELVKFLHAPPLSSLSPQPLFNFKVHLNRDRNPVRRNRGTGILTLPSREIGERFLQLHGSEQPRTPIKIGARTAKFMPKSRPPNAETLHELRSLLFTNPRNREEEEEMQDEPDKVKIKTLQFGWLCRDDTFSIECEERCDGRCDITYHKDRREIMISLRVAEEKYRVAMTLSSIRTVSASSSKQSIVFDLHFAPSYEKDPEPRHKLCYLPIEDHDRVAPFASLTIRVICASQRDFRTFRGLCRTAQLHRLDDYDHHAEPRHLFSFTVMSTMVIHLANLPWIVAFQMEGLLRNLTIDFQEAITLHPLVVQTIETEGPEFTAKAIRNFRNKTSMLVFAEDEPDFDVVQLFQQMVQELRAHGHTAPLPPDGSLYEALHVGVTPTTMYFDGPYTDQSNRVIRAYDVEDQAFFLRVNFVDEALLQYRFDREIDGRQFIQSRVGPLLRDGLKIAGRMFNFLAYSQSALKEHAVWFVKPFQDRITGNTVDAKSIIASLGTFDGLQFDKKLMYCPARYAARISQAFTATDAVKVEVETVDQVEDIVTSDGKYQFTDGVGTLSKELSREIWNELRRARRGRRQKDTPSAYQVRFQGSKGMLSVDYTLTGSTICLRPSMIKFSAPETVRDIEIARAFDRPGPYFLNRPLIMLLEGLGVPLDVFMRYQDQAVEATRKATRSLKDAAALLERQGLGASYRLPSILLNLVKLEVISLPDDEFYSKMLEFAINHVLRDLKNQSRIPIPGGWTLVGVADTHRYLQPNEIFACVKPLNGGRRYLSGRVLISRSPTIHPGDVAVVQAIGPPPPNSCFSEESLPNTVVFSVQGPRPIPSCLGGGDLDGDLYNLIPLDDPEFPELNDFTPQRLYEPASYDAVEKKVLDHPSTMNDVADFVMEYISSDVVGIVAMNWLIIADQSREGIRDKDCLTLANLHSNAVDYPKSGQPVPLKDIPKLKYKKKPDWNAPETIGVNALNYYPSRRAIGHLFRAIDLPIDQQRSLRPRGRRRQGLVRHEDELEARFNRFDPAEARESDFFLTIEERVQEFIATDGDRNDEEVASITGLFQRYASELQATCMSTTISHTRIAQISEAEAVVGTIAQKTSQRGKRKEAMAKLRENTDRLTRGVRDDLAGDDSLTAEESLRRAWMAFEFAISQGKTFGAKSFGWVALGAIFDAIKELDDE